jgi:hypothetical protein
MDRRFWGLDVMDMSNLQNRLPGSYGLNIMANNISLLKLPF